jgi:hypothetical protein
MPGPRTSRFGLATFFLGVFGASDLRRSAGVFGTATWAEDSA